MAGLRQVDEVVNPKISVANPLNMCLTITVPNGRYLNRMLALFIEFIISGLDTSVETLSKTMDMVLSSGRRLKVRPERARE
jgi:hypothetical protein